MAAVPSELAYYIEKTFHKDHIPHDCGDDEGYRDSPCNGKVEIKLAVQYCYGNQKKTRYFLVWDVGDAGPDGRPQGRRIVECRWDRGPAAPMLSVRTHDVSDIMAGLDDEQQMAVAEYSLGGLDSDKYGTFKRALKIVGRDPMRFRTVLPREWMKGFVEYCVKHGILDEIHVANVFWSAAAQNRSCEWRITELAFLTDIFMNVDHAIQNGYGLIRMDNTEELG